MSGIEVNSSPAAVRHITVNYWSQQHFSWGTIHHCQLLKSTPIQLKYNTSLSALQLKFRTSLSTIEVNSTPAEVQHINVRYWSQLHSSWSTTHHCQLLKSTALQLKYNTSLSTIEVNCTPAEVQHITVRYWSQLHPAEVQHITVNYWSQLHSSWSTTHHCQLLKSTALQLQYNTSLSTIEVNSTPAEVQHIPVSY